MCRSKETSTAYSDEGQIDIQIPFGNRTSLDLGINGKWYDVRLMHTKERFGKSEGPDPALGRIWRISNGYCMGEHCYNRFAINASAKGMGSHKIYYIHEPNIEPEMSLLFAFDYTKYIHFL